MNKNFTKVRNLLICLLCAVVLAGCGTKSKTLQSAVSTQAQAVEGENYTSTGAKHVKGQGENIDYRRSSLYSVLVRHTEKGRKYADDIASVFPEIPIPEKYNDHNLGIRSVNAAMKNKSTSTHGKQNIEKTIEPFLNQNQIAKEMVAKWFNRKSDGTFDMNLVKERGLYDADYFDAQMAEQSVRGMSLLADAGEDLIGNSFVIFNDIEYIDKEEVAKGVGTGLKILGTIATVAAAASGNRDLARTVNAATNVAVAVTDDIGGFRVNVTTYLYRLRWDDETSGTFYSQYFTTTPDAAKKAAFEADKTTFHLDYIGSYKVSTAKTTLSGTKDQHGMIRKVCQRAIDKNISSLQKQYEDFRVKTPLFSTTPLSAKVGLKEDVTTNSKFEVLEEVEDSKGKTYYKRVGVVRPIKGKIWDNRYLADAEDENKGKTRTATEFKVVSGSNFYPGMLLRQIK